MCYPINQRSVRIVLKNNLFTLTAHGTGYYTLMLWHSFSSIQEINILTHFTCVYIGSGVAAELIQHYTNNDRGNSTSNSA